MVVCTVCYNVRHSTLIPWSVLHVSLDSHNKEEIFSWRDKLGGLCNVTAVLFIVRWEVNFMPTSTEYPVHILNKLSSYAWDVGA